MPREDNLDARLDALQRAAHGQWDARPAAPWAAAEREQEDAELETLVEAARRLAPLAEAYPSPAFASDLRRHLLARAGERRADREALAALETVPLTRVARSGQPARRSRARQPRSAWRVALVAAALLVTLGTAGLGAALAAAGAAPGNPLYGLHQFEHMVRVNTASDSASRAQLHLDYARQLLANLRTAANQPVNEPAYAAALSMLLQEDQAATQQIDQVPAGAERTALQQSLASLHADERPALRAALPNLGWADRFTTTQTLGTLGVAIPRVTSAEVLVPDHGQWTVTLSGSGFEPGAILLLDGRPAGQVTTITATSLTALVPRGLIQNGAASLGVGNPDGMTALFTSTNIQQVAQPKPKPTATPDGHGNGNGSGNGHGNGHVP
ncbi:MAG TPA: hypothetical protein VGN32_01290 [Ktedonobacterales bacterium]|nr:hypothetical protein [Ktedonobacterales bacterium]